MFLQHILWILLCVSISVPNSLFFQKFTGRYHLMSQELQSKILLVFGVPFTFVTSYCVQKKYDDKRNKKQRDSLVSKGEQNCLT